MSGVNSTNFLTNSLYVDQNPHVNFGATNPNNNTHENNLLFASTKENAKIVPLEADQLQLSKQTTPEVEEGSKGLKILGVIGATVAAVCCRKKIGSAFKSLGKLLKSSSDDAAKTVTNTAKKTSNVADDTAKGVKNTTENISKGTQKTVEKTSNVVDDTKKVVTKTADNAAESSKIESELKKAVDKSQEGCVENAMGKFMTPADHSVGAYMEALTRGDFKVKKVLTVGGESSVFELTDGKILKLSPLKYKSGNPEFYAPEIKRGAIELNNLHEGVNGGMLNKINYVIQEKGNINVSAEDIKKFEKLLANKGLKITDPAGDQFAYFTDIKTGAKSVKAIDLGCINGTTVEFDAFQGIEKASKQPIKDLRTSFASELNCQIRELQEFGYYNNNALMKFNKEIPDITKKAKKAVQDGETLLNAINTQLKEYGYKTIRDFSSN